FPAFLLVVPLARRDWRCLAGAAVTLFLGLIVVPAVVLGPRTAWEVNRDYAEVLVGPSLGLGHDSSRSGELIDATATKSQPFLVVMHKTIPVGSGHVPPRPSWWVRWLHLLLGAILTLAVLAKGGGMRRADGLALTTQIGLLGVLMAVLCPVCHLHY